MYDYIKRSYPFQPEVGKRVRHTVINQEGVIAREDRGQGNYVQVKFDGRKFAVPCHPGELVYV